MAKGSNLWSTFFQSLLVALSIFLFTQLWTRKENNQRIREALFDMKSEIVHNGVLIDDAKNALERMQSFRIGLGYTYVQGLQTQSLQRNLILVSQQKETYSETLVKYYANVDELKKFCEEELAAVGFTSQQIQDSESQLDRLVVRRDSFIVNEDRIQNKYPSLVNNTEREVELTSRNIQTMRLNQRRIQENVRTMLLTRLKLASGEQTLATATIAAIYANLDLGDVHLYGYMGKLFLIFLFMAFIPTIVREHKKWLRTRRAELNSGCVKDKTQDL